MRDRGDGGCSGGESGEVTNVLQCIEFEASALHAASLQAAGRSSLGGGDGGDAMQWVREHRVTYCGTPVHLQNHSQSQSQYQSQNQNQVQNQYQDQNMSMNMRLKSKPVQSVRDISPSLAIARALPSVPPTAPAPSKLRVSFSKHSTSAAAASSDERCRPLAVAGPAVTKSNLKRPVSRPLDSRISPRSREPSPPAPPAPHDSDEIDLQDVIQERYHSLLRQMRTGSSNERSSSNSRGVSKMPTRASTSMNSSSSNSTSTSTSMSTSSLALLAPARTATAATTAATAGAATLSSAPLHIAGQAEVGKMEEIEKGRDAGHSTLYATDPVLISTTPYTDRYQNAQSRHTTPSLQRGRGAGTGTGAGAGAVRVTRRKFEDPALKAVSRAALSAGPTHTQSHTLQHTQPHSQPHTQPQGGAPAIMKRSVSPQSVLKNVPRNISVSPGRTSMSSKRAVSPKLQRSPLSGTAEGSKPGRGHGEAAGEAAGQVAGVAAGKAQGESVGETAGEGSNKRPTSPCTVPLSVLLGAVSRSESSQEEHSALKSITQSTSETDSLTTRGSSLKPVEHDTVGRMKGSVSADSLLSTARSLHPPIILNPSIDPIVRTGGRDESNSGSDCTPSDSRSSSRSESRSRSDSRSRSSSPIRTAQYGGDSSMSPGSARDAGYSPSVTLQPDATPEGYRQDVGSYSSTWSASATLSPDSLSSRPLNRLPDIDTVASSVRSRISTVSAVTATRAATSAVAAVAYSVPSSSSSVESRKSAHLYGDDEFDRDDNSNRHRDRDRSDERRMVSDEEGMGDSGSRGSRGSGQRGSDRERDRERGRDTDILSDNYTSSVRSRVSSAVSGTTAAVAVRGARGAIEAPSTSSPLSSSSSPQSQLSAHLYGDDELYSDREGVMMSQTEDERVMESGREREWVGDGDSRGSRQHDRNRNRDGDRDSDREIDSDRDRDRDRDTLSGMNMESSSLQSQGSRQRDRDGGRYRDTVILSDIDTVVSSVLSRVSIVSAVPVVTATRAATSSSSVESRTSAHLYGDKNLENKRGRNRDKERARDRDGDSIKQRSFGVRDSGSKLTDRDITFSTLPESCPSLQSVSPSSDVLSSGLASLQEYSPDTHLQDGYVASVSSASTPASASASASPSEYSMNSADKSLASRLRLAVLSPAAEFSLQRLLSQGAQECQFSPLPSGCGTPVRSIKKDPPPIDFTGVLSRSRSRIDVLDVWIDKVNAIWAVKMVTEESEEPCKRIAASLEGGFKNEEVQSVLGPPPLLVLKQRSAERTVRAFKEKLSMREMRAEIDASLQDLALIQRNEVLSWDANDALRVVTKAARRATAAAAGQAVLRVSKYEEQVRAVCDDVIAARHWNPFVQSVTQEVEVSACT